MKHLHKNVIWVFWLNSFIGFTFLCLFSLVFLGSVIETLLSITSNRSFQLLFIQMLLKDWLLIAPLVITLSLILSYIWAYLSYKFYKYELARDGFKKELGVIYKKYVTIPYDRIQNVDIYRGILARLLGISDIQIQTAGMSGIALSEGRLPGLSKKDAEELRDQLIHRVSNSKDQGL